MEAGAGGFEMCDLMKGEHMKEEFLKLNPFHHIPTVQDGDISLGESVACLRYLALKYKPECYPVEDPVACGFIDFAADSFATEVYPKIGPKIFYPVFGFVPSAPEDQAKANEEASVSLDTWMKHFVKGKFVNGNKVSIADYKAVPFLFALMQPGVEKKTGFKLSDRAKQYVEDFNETVKASAFLKTAGGFSIQEFAAMKVPDGGEPSAFQKVQVPEAPAYGKAAGADIKVFGMPPSANACGPILLAMDAKVGGFEMCNLFTVEQHKPEFLAMNPFHHIPTIKDGDVALGESNACLRYLAMKYKPEYYPVKEPATCGMIDFACESFGGDVYPKIGYGVIYPIFGFSGPVEDQAKANKEATEMLDCWINHFVKGKFVNGDKLSIADFKAAPFIFAAMQPVIKAKAGFEVSDKAKTYVENFMAAVEASAFLKSAGGYAIVEYAASKA
jgi:glutathione S-transferase